MFSRLRKIVSPLLLSEALEVVQNRYDKKSRSRRWFPHPVKLLSKIMELDRLGYDVEPDTYDLIRDMEHCLDRYRVTDVQKYHILAWERYVENSPNERRGGPRSEHTVDHYKRGLRRFFNVLVETKHLTSSPADALSFEYVPESEPKHLTQEQVDLLLKAASQSLRDYAIIQVFRASGVRIEGLSHMRLSSLRIDKIPIAPERLGGDVADLVTLAAESGLSHVIRDEFRYRYEGEFLVKEKGKNGRKRNRAALLDHEACTALIAYLDTRPPAATHDRVWLSDKTIKPLSQNGVYMAFKRVAERAGVNASPHVLRHTFAMNLANSGVFITHAAKLLGHSDPMTTARIYVKPRKEDLRRAYRKIEENPGDSNTDLYSSGWGGTA